MTENTERQKLIKLLKDKAAETGRLPKKGDFTNDISARIKSIWGPWRYALEEAELIEDKSEERKEKKKEKRERSKENRAKKTNAK